MHQSAIAQKNIATIRRTLLSTAKVPVWFAVGFLLLFPSGLQAQNRAAVRKVSPEYPAVAKQMNITGTVVVMATVDASGKVIKVESSSGNKLLASAAMDAVRQWKFAAGDATTTFPVNVVFEKN